jgi:hypothetical protein
MVYGQLDMDSQVLNQDRVILIKLEDLLEVQVAIQRGQSLNQERLTTQTTRILKETILWT